MQQQNIVKSLAFLSRTPQLSTKLNNKGEKGAYKVEFVGSRKGSMALDCEERARSRSS